MKSLLSRVTDLLGIEFSPVSHVERIVSGAGGFAGILLVLLVSQFFLGLSEAVLIVASMGASAVLLFAVPHGALSQPWPLVGGHLVSAIIGVTCAKLFPATVTAAALAVAVAIVVMHYLRCIHPPGGATALSAVVGGPAVQALGFEFVFTPVLLNVVVILIVAVAFNYMFYWRRYPAALKSVRIETPEAKLAHEAPHVISHADMVYALSEIGSFIDVTEHDLLRIYDLATQRASRVHLEPSQLKLGRYYSNGLYGNEWSVRQIVDESVRDDPGKDTVVFEVIAGAGRRTSGVCTRIEFGRWAKHEVVRQESSW